MKQFLATVLARAGGICILSSVGLVMYQIYFWLQNGYWKDISLLYPLYNYWEWASDPTSWLGWHQLLDSIPLSLGLFLVGILLFVVWSEMSEDNF